MEIQIRDDRQRKAFTGLSQAPCDSLLPVFSDISQATQHHKYEAGVKAGTRARKPGGGFKGKWPPMADTLRFVLSDSTTYPPFDVLGTPWELGRSQAHAHLQKFSPIFDDTLVH